MNFLFYLGAAAVIAVIVLVGVLSGRKAKNESFSGAKSGGAAIVAGALIGTLVGGSSTIGTAQLAYTKGFSAWWYTLGGGLGLLILGLVFASPIYKRKDVKTIPDIVSAEFGSRSGVLVALLGSLGTFLSFVAQILSGCALMQSVFGFGFRLSVGIMSLLIVAYVFFGGAQALGRAGIVKTVIIGASVLICGVAALFFAGGTTVAGNLGNAEIFPRDQFLNLFARGVVKDAGAGLSLIVGVVTTQSYVSAILMARNATESKKGAVASAVIVPVMGLASLFVGLYMRANVTDAAFDAKMALPDFIMEHMPSALAGVMIAALLVTVVGTGAGLSMGMATMMYKNLFAVAVQGRGKKLNEKLVIRIILVGVTLLGAGLCFANLGDLILDWSFLSQGLRGAVGFLPLVCALFFPGKIDRRAVLVSMPMAVICSVLGNSLLPKNVDCLFAGLGASLIAVLVGYFMKKHSKN